MTCASSRTRSYCPTAVETTGCCGVVIVLNVALSSFNLQAFLSVLQAILGYPVTAIVLPSAARRRLLSSSTTVTVAAVNITAQDLITNINLHNDALQQGLGYNVTSLAAASSAASPSGSSGGSSVVPVAVGAAVGGAALVVLVALFIRSRRARSPPPASTARVVGAKSQRGRPVVSTPHRTDNTVARGGAHISEPHGERMDDFSEPAHLQTATKGRALYDFDGGSYEGALSVRAGDTLVLTGTLAPGGWCEVTCGGRRGVVPVDYIDMGSSNDEDLVCYFSLS